MTEKPDDVDILDEESAEEILEKSVDDQDEFIDPELKCWELRTNCMMKGLERDKAGCPAYRNGVGCWEVDWKQIVEALPASQREYWLSFLSNCANCISYKAHSVEMQARIDAVKAVIFDD